jgi:4-alpha-glucanotransferase
LRGRHVGINVPLFSLRSTTGWGIGELTDVERVAPWLERAGIDRLLLLPLGTMQAGETSPYSAVSTLAIDPIFISLDALPDFERAGGLACLSAEGRMGLDEAREAPSVRHDLVRTAKAEALRAAFQSFVLEEWGELTPRAAELASFVARERAWLGDYALYLAIKDAQGGRRWLEWPAPLRDRDPRALDDARRHLGREVLEHQYRQWIADGQWQRARRAAAAHGIRILGDLPFVAASDSPEIWAHADEFDLSVSVGVPPDAFSATGQDWGLPLYRWDVIGATDYAWLRQRSARMAALYDGLRVDHVIGLYRTYARRATGEAFFSPGDESRQIEQGRAVMTTMAESGLELIAEDLGVIPDFVRASLATLGIPGCKVLRWERDWHAPGAPFLEPATFTPVSAAMTGTHDTEPLAVWWTVLGEHDRRAVLQLEGLARRAADGPLQPWNPALRDALLTMAYRCGSNDLFLPLQDVFGWSERVNVPGTVGPENWTWCLPWPVDEFDRNGEATERAVFLAALGRAAGRG